jgi:HEPN domain-containing protein
MTPPEQAKRRLLREWLRKADADLAVAEHLLSDETPFHEAVCFHCQQAAEKYLKALLVWREVYFPKTHDLEELLDLADTVNQHVAAGLRDTIVLTPYGVELRYPGDRPDATSAQARQAVELARLVRDKVMPVLSELPGTQR